MRIEWKDLLKKMILVENKVSDQQSFFIKYSWLWKACCNLLNN